MLKGFGNLLRHLFEGLKLCTTDLFKGLECIFQSGGVHFPFIWEARPNIWLRKTLIVNTIVSKS